MSARRVLQRAVALGATGALMASGMAFASASGAAPTPPVIDHWVPVEAGSHQRAVVVVYAVGGCDSTRTAVKESKTAIRITITSRAAELPKGMVCADTLRRVVQTVRLKHPIAGRHLLGWSLRPRHGMRAFVTYLRRTEPGGRVVPLVPRVIGFAPGDATKILELQGFRVRVTGHGRAITTQAPGRGQTAPGGNPKTGFGGVVTLGRNTIFLCTPLGRVKAC